MQKVRNNQTVDLSFIKCFCIVLSQYTYSFVFLLYTGVPESHISSFCKMSRDKIDDIILTGMEV